MGNIASIIAKALAAAGMALLTEKFIIKMTIKVLEYLVKSTKTDLDDKILEEVKKALGESGKL